MILTILAIITANVIAYLVTGAIVPTSHARTWDRYAHDANRSPRVTMGARKARYVKRVSV